MCSKKTVCGMFSNSCWDGVSSCFNGWVRVWRMTADELMSIRKVCVYVCTVFQTMRYSREPHQQHTLSPSHTTQSVTFALSDTDTHTPLFLWSVPELSADVSRGSVGWWQGGEPRQHVSLHAFQTKWQNYIVTRHYTSVNPASLHWLQNKQCQCE